MEDLNFTDFNVELYSDHLPFARILLNLDEPFDELK